MFKVPLRLVFHVSKGFLKKGYHSRYSYMEISDSEKENLIPIISLENAIKNCINKFGSCDVLKIDIEGMGYLALNTINIDFIWMFIAEFLGNDWCIL